MGLDEIKISGPVLTELYRNNLLSGNPLPEKNPNPLSPVLILTDRSAKMAEESDLFLKEILKACKIPEQKICILDIPEGKKTTVEKAIEKHNPSLVLVFGEVPRIKDAPAHEVFEKTLLKDTQVLFCPGLTRLREDKEIKGKLWNILKELFGIS